MVSRMQHAAWALAVVGAGGAGAGVATASIAYDNITGNSSPISLHPDTFEYADDTTLAPAQGLRITSVAVLVTNPFQAGDYEGALRVRLYAAGAGEPGTLLGSSVIGITVAQGDLITIDVPFDVTIPGLAIWTSFQFVSPSSPLPGVITGGTPSVGSSTNRTASRAGGTGSWTQSTTLQNPFAYQITTVPAPAGLAIAGVGLPLLRRGRR